MALTKSKDVLRGGANNRRGTAVPQKKQQFNGNVTLTNGKQLLQQQCTHNVISLRESAGSKAIKPTAETTEPAR